MAHVGGTKRAPNYQQWAERPTPQWFKDSKLGIFVHWGAYSVPAFAETSGQLGFIEQEMLAKHNPYAEWYFNTIRFPDSDAARYHKEHYGNEPYDSLIDKWTASDFDAEKLVDLFAKAGARYVVPVTKHHVSSSHTRNTVHRGPKRDVVAEFAEATEKSGLKFGVYYSTGIDWHKWPTDKPWNHDNWARPSYEDHAYNAYAWNHCADLIERYKPAVLWGDIDWPKAGVAPGDHSVEALLTKLYEANEGAVINDRFGDTHWDFVTVEYGHGEKPKEPQMWQSTRGIGCSFGYNKMETSEQYLSGAGAIALLVDVVAGGGNLLLNVGPDETGKISAEQVRCLEYMAVYMAVNAVAIHDTDVVDAAIAKPLGVERTEDAWVRWTRRGNRIFAFVDGKGTVALSVAADKVDVSKGKLLSGEEVALNGEVNLADVPTDLRPVCIEVQLK